MRNCIHNRPIRVGVLGAFRGEAFARTATATGMELVAVCDKFKHRLDEVCGRLNVRGYQNFEEFIAADFDAVVIAAPFHQHAPFAIEALKQGKHVLSETSCNATLREGVELYRAVRESGLCYMLAENYCYTRFNQEMRRLYLEGEIGEVRYAEGEYNHPMSTEEQLWYSPGVKHWRHQLPGCYYNTHALAPLMYMTDTMPVEVSCSRVQTPERRDGLPGYQRDSFVFLVRMDNGALFRLIGMGFGGHSCWYSLHGTVGAVESVRGHGYFGSEQVRVWHEPWDVKPGQPEERVYLPAWPAHGKEAEESGHGGGDFFVELAFADAVRTGAPPYLDAYRGVMMSNVGILGWRSALQNGAFLPVPDLRDPAAQEALWKDDLTPFDGMPNATLLPDDMRALTVLDEETIKKARVAWKRLGYSDAEIEELLKG